MFTSARIKLTAWYLLIIMSVSISFSVVIHQMLNREVERFARIQRSRLERRYRDNFLQQLLPVPDEVLIIPQQLDPDLLKEASQHILLTLIVVNGVIFIVSGCLGYILAGRTLEPIQQMLDEQNRFISDSSHELRTPLTALKSSLEVNLRDKKLSLAAARTVMKESIDDVNKLQLLSDALLQLAQYRNTTHKPAFAPIRINECAKEAMKKLSPIAKAKNIAIETDFETDVTVNGDKYAVVELIAILLDNAIKYSHPKQTVIVAVSQNNTGAYIRVKDSGIGISQKDIPHVFDRFYRADIARSKTETPGYGLGLSIAKKIAGSHNGTVSVVSKLNEGSVFTVRLPRSFS